MRGGVVAEPAWQWTAVVEGHAVGECVSNVNIRKGVSRYREAKHAVF